MFTISAMAGKRAAVFIFTVTALILNAATTWAGVSNTFFYLNGPVKKSSYNITLGIKSIEVAGSGGEWTSILTAPVEMNSIDMVDSQALLANVELQTGKYGKIRLKFSRATLSTEDRKMELVYPEEGMIFDYNFEAGGNDTIPVFMSWDVDRCVVSHINMGACFSFSGKAAQLSEVAGYVVSEEADSVFVIDKNSYSVVSIIRVGKAPKGIAVNPDTNRVFVLNSGDDSLSVIDSTYGKVIYTTGIEGGSKATSISLNRQTNKLYVANSATNSVTALDASTLRMSATIPVGINPVTVISNPVGSKVFVINYASRDISVIDSSRDVVTETIKLDQYPERGEVDIDGDKLYVVSPSSYYLIVIALSTSKVSKKIRFPDKPLAVMPDPLSKRLFITKGLGGSVVLFDSDLRLDMLSASAGKYPVDMEIDQQTARLYVVNRDSGTVDVFDQITLEHIKTIMVGKKTWGMVLVK